MDRIASSNNTRLTSIQDQREKKMFGCTAQESKEGLDQLAKFYFGDANMALVKLLSDVQELITHPNEFDLEVARQCLNRAKQAITQAGPIQLWQRNG